MNLSTFLASLRARWWLLAATFLITAVTALGISLLLPKRYQAMASVVVDAKPDPVSAMIYPGLASPAFMNTQVDVLQSERVALRVVRELKLTDNPEFRERWQIEARGRGTLEQWLAGMLLKKVEIRPSKESNVLSIFVSWSEPRFAAAVANAWVKAFIATTLELRVDPARQYSNFFETQVREARTTLERAQARLSEFQKANGIIASDERLDVENARLQELSSQLVALQAQQADAVSRDAQVAARRGDRMQEVLNNPLINQLKSEITRAEAQLQDLMARYGDAHPQVISAKASLAEQRAKLEQETKAAVGSVGVTLNINRQRVSEVRGALESQRDKLVRLRTVRDEGMVLQRDVDNAQKAYDTVFARSNQTQLESQNTQSNINLLTEAVAPAEPAGPNVALNTVIAAMAGLVLGAGLCTVLELRDRRVRGPQDLAEALDLPVIGVLGGPGPSVAKLARPQMAQRLLGHSPVSANKVV